MSYNEFALSVGQAHELELAFRRNYWTNEDVKKLCKGTLPYSVLRQVRDVLHEKSVIKEIEDHVIDCDVTPSIPYEGYYIESHRKMGKWKWNPHHVELLSLPEQGRQDDGVYVSGEDLCKQIIVRPALNACVLDYLLAHPHLIPDEWNAVLFWGTIYSRDKDKRVPGHKTYRHIRCIGRMPRTPNHPPGPWRSNLLWLGEDFGKGRRAAVLRETLPQHILDIL